MDENELTGLALSFKNGSERSFKRLVDSLTRPLIAMAYRYTLDWESARDITQETWVRVYKKIDGYDSERPFRSWLYAVHRNACLSHLRRPFLRREGSYGRRTSSGRGDISHRGHGLRSGSEHIHGSACLPLERSVERKGTRQRGRRTARRTTHKRDIVMIGATLALLTELRIKVNMPDKIVETNATSQEGNTLVWRLEPGNALDHPIEIYAESVPEE